MIIINPAMSSSSNSSDKLFFISLIFKYIIHTSAFQNNKISKKELIILKNSINQQCSNNSWNTLYIKEIIINLFFCIKFDCYIK